MPDLRSALASCIHEGEYGAVKGSTALTLSEKKLGLLYQVAGWNDFEEKISPLLAKLKLGNTGNFTVVQKIDSISCFKVGPDRVMVRDGAHCSLLPVVDDKDLAIVDLSHARTVIRIEGRKSEDLLARLSGIDFSLIIFSVGSFVQTGIHHVGVLIERCSADCFDLYIPTTWAESIWQLITLNAKQFGYRVEGGVK